MNKGSFLVLVMLATLILSSCEYKDIERDETVVVEEMSFSNDIEPIFKKQSCTNCHNGTTTPDLTSGNAYQSLISDDFINLNTPTESKIYVVPKVGSGHPATCTSQQSNQILAWIEQGAKNN
jgi:hypothetical protein